MTNLDQFESEFRSATRTLYAYSPAPIGRTLLVTDDASAGDPAAQAVQSFLHSAGHPSATVEQTSLAAAADLGGLLQQIEQSPPDLIVTHRSLASEAWRWPYTLGDAVEVLTQAIAPPVLLLPHPTDCADYGKLLKNADSVMAITDHLTGDNRLVDYAVAMTQPGGQLALSHVEDEAALNRIMDAISKIPELDTDTSQAEIGPKLLKGPREFVQSIEATLTAAEVDVRVHGHASFGHRLKDHVQLVEDHHVDLLVLNTKDEDQLAMHGLAYPLAVQLRQTPLLML